jgi:hypothetical protein
MKKTFSHMAIDEGVVAQRSFSCWCAAACMRAESRGHGSMNSNLAVAGCERAQDQDQRRDWKEVSVARCDAAGIANSKTRARACATRCAQTLQNAFRQRPNEAIWVGWLCRTGGKMTLTNFGLAGPQRSYVPSQAVAL